MGTRGCDPFTLVNGIPKLSARLLPQSGCSFRLLETVSIDATHADELACTGSVSTGVFQKLSAGKTGQPSRVGGDATAHSGTATRMARGRRMCHIMRARAPRVMDTRGLRAVTLRTGYCAKTS